MIETLRELDAVLAHVEFQDWRFYASHMGNGFYVQARFPAVDPTHRRLEEQHGRKWYVSRHATPVEVVQTCLKAVLTALEHEAREGFTYKGVPVFQPHLNLEQLVELAQATVLRALTSTADAEPCYVGGTPPQAPHPPPFYLAPPGFYECDVNGVEMTGP